MKTILRFSVLFALAIATQATAAFESVKLNSDNPTPQFPPRLIMDGVTEGYAAFAVSISAEGRMTDRFVLGYAHELFMRSCEAALKDWQFIPARLDGQNVPVQIELKFNFKREGVVETSSINIVNNFLFDRFDGMAESRFAYRLPRSNELERAPVPVATVEPQYAEQAEKDGVRGRVRVYFYIDENGAVRMPSVKSDSNPYLSDIAVTALRGWRFEPAVRRGEKVSVAAAQEFNFGTEK